MNKDAGRGSHLYVTLRLDSGEELLFLVDTGSPMIVLDRSLEPRLGECLGADTLLNFGDRYDASRYAAPKLFIGSTRLITDSNALTSDFLARTSSREDRSVMGVLGMDCLQHYCVQLDFKAGKMRFLDPNRLKPAGLGKAFPLTFSNEGSSYTEWVRPYIHHRHLVGDEEIDLLIDTGHDGDGALEPQLLRRAIREHVLRVEADANDANEPEGASLPKCTWSSETYTDLLVRNGRNTTESDDGENSLGLRFLARHLVTFDFPGRTMYLKRTSSGPLISRDVRNAARRAVISAYKPARKLMREGQLPGWSTDDRGAFAKTARFHPNPDTVTFHASKKHDSSTYHYRFTRASQDDLWTLEKAWRTDQDDRTTEEYPVPQEPLTE